MKDLNPILSPRSIAVVGASSRPLSVGHEMMNNILRYGFTGAIYPVNPRAFAIHGIRSYQSVIDIPDPVDAAFIVLKRDLVLPAVQECIEKGVKGVVVITAGFKETDEEGAELERLITEKLRAAGAVLLGPNCMGAFNSDPGVRLNTTFARFDPRPGPIGLISQSGAMGAQVLDFADERHMGFAKFLSIGNKSDVDENDALEFFTGDGAVGVIMLYLENFADAARFRELCARATRIKPVVVLKAGRSGTGAKAASSHTGALAGSDTAVNALLESCGAIRADTVDDLLSICHFFSAPRRPKGDRLALVTNAGGPGVIAADELEAVGFPLPALREETVRRLAEQLPPEASCANPCDILPGSGAKGYEVAVEALSHDANIDAVVVLWTPPVWVKTKWVIDAIKPHCERSPVPVIGLFSGAGDLMADGLELAAAGVPIFTSAPQVARVLSAGRQYRRRLEREELPPPKVDADREAAARILGRAGPGWLEPEDAFGVLAAYGVATVRSARAKPGDDPAAAAAELRYPLAAKIDSPDILHKSDAGGVELAIADADDLRQRCRWMIERVQKSLPQARIDGLLIQEMAGGGTELIVGVKREPGFGPLVMCGMGGVLVEVLRDVAFALAPLAGDEPALMLERLRSFAVLRGVRGRAGVDLDAAAGVIASVSALAVDFPAIDQLDINPLLAGASGCLAVDARIRIGGE